LRGVLQVVLGVYVCAALQQNIAGIDLAVISGEVKGCAAAADAVCDKHAAKNKHPTPALQFNDISRGRLLAASRVDARWVHREMIGHERVVAAFSSFNNVGLDCDSRGGGSLQKTRVCDSRRRARGKKITHTFCEAEAAAGGGGAA
jgi:hypothetical protein